MYILEFTTKTSFDNDFLVFDELEIAEWHYNDMISWENILSLKLYRCIPIKSKNDDLINPNYVRGMVKTALNHLEELPINHLLKAEYDCLEAAKYCLNEALHTIDELQENNKE